MKELIRMILLAVFILIITFVAFRFIMSFKKEPPMNELVESVKLVKVQKVKLNAHPLSVPVYGNIQSLNEIELFPEVGGKLMSQNFREGTEYRKGETIAYIENGELANNIKSQKSNFLNQVAKVVADMTFDFPNEVSKWEVFLENINFDKPLPSLPEVKDAKLKNYLAGKNLYNSYFAIEAQELRLSKYAIVAPFDGILAEALIKPGTVVRAGQKIGKFINPAEFELEASVKLIDGNKIKIGDRAIVKSDELAGTWDGTVVRVNKTVSQNSQNMEVFIGVKSPDLYSGMYVYGDVYQGEADEAIAISRNLLYGNMIYKIEQEKLVEQPVNVLQSNDETVIVQGLQEGELILAEPVKDAFNGMKVRF